MDDFETWSSCLDSWGSLQSSRLKIAEEFDVVHKTVNRRLRQGNKEIAQKKEETQASS